MKKEHTIDDTNKKRPLNARLKKTGFYATLFYGLWLLVLFVIFWPDFKDGSFFSALGKIDELPVYSLIALTALFTALITFVASILIYKLKPFGVPLLLISTALWEFVMVLGLIEDNISGISLALTICPLVIAFLAVYFWRKGG